ncbi:MAG: glycosyltransferase family 4 protein [Candidatus Firestonebacteria bacterium]
MKIAFIYDVIYPYVKGGAEKRFWELAKRLSAKGHQTHLYGMKSWIGPSDFIKEGVFIHGIGRHIPLYSKSGIRNIRQALYFSLRILPRLWKEKFDIIDCNAFPYLPFFPIKLFSSLKKIPLVITWQEIWESYWYGYLGYFKGHIARCIEKMVIKLAPNIIAHTRRIKNELIRCGAGENSIRIIPDGIDINFIDKAPPKKENIDLLFAGRLIKDKNVDILIEAVSRLKNDFGNLKCVIIGDGPEKNNLVRLADKLYLNSNVIFKGFLQYQEVISYMKSASIFVFPSTREGFGIVAIEAMACGLPVITIQHPMNASRELIKDGKNGFLSNLSPEDLASKIFVLLSNNELRNTLSSTAKNSISEYDWNAIAGQNEEFYRHILAKNH